MALDIDKQSNWEPVRNIVHVIGLCIYADTSMPVLEF